MREDVWWAIRVRECVTNSCVGGNMCETMLREALGFMRKTIQERGGYM